MARDALVAEIAKAAPRIALVGPTPQKLGADMLVVFLKRTELVNGFPSYTKAGDGGAMMWHAGVCWHVGAAADLGQDRGWVVVLDGCLRPEASTAMWQVYDGTAWVDAPALRCLAGDALAAEIAKAAPRIALVGPTPQNQQADMLGVFLKRTELVNGFPSYTKAGDGGVMLWHAGESWTVGAAANLGQDRGWVSVRDSCLRPEASSVTWDVYDGTTWINAPELRCLAGRAATSQRIWGFEEGRWLSADNMFVDARISAPASVMLLDLPTELLARCVALVDSPGDIARVAAVSLLFHASLAEAIRLWAQERGFELPALPEDESCAVRWLCFAALLRESNPPVRLAAGARHSLFIDGEGRLLSCGTAEEGEEDEEGEWEAERPGLLGHGEGVTRLNTPTRLPSALGGERAVSVAAGAWHSLTLTADGSVWSWGDGGQGCLGHGDQQEQWLPKKVEAFAGQHVVAVWAGGGHSLAITADGAVCSWGYGAAGRLGHGDAQNQLLPKKIEALAGQRVVTVSAGGSHSIALTAGGELWSWGSGVFGKLGHGDEQRQLLPKKVEALAGQRVVAVSAGACHSLAITADGAVWSWGAGGEGRLGHVDQQGQLLPKQVEAWVDRRVVAVSAGDDHNLAITVNGAVWSWGYGASGQLGHGNRRRKLLPKKVDSIAGQRVVAVSAGESHSLALTADGAVFAWGKGEDGCLGQGEDLSNQLLPRKIKVWAQGQ